MTKDYSFLATVVTSVVASVVYMVVFHVTPWDTYMQMEARRGQVAFHGTLGQRLIENGQYEPAKEEFKRALTLDPLDQKAQRGLYLADLFLALDEPTWDPGIWSAMRDPLMDRSRAGDQEVAHVIEKYLGDVEQRIANTDNAQAHYEKALDLKPDYLDALYTYGWLTYSSIEQPDVARMEKLFRRMTDLDQYDFRGFHGLGYALYMQALQLDGPERTKLMKQAADQSLMGGKLRFQQLNVTMDFGEVARSENPEQSIGFHEAALKLLDGPATASLLQVNGSLGVQLLMEPGHVYLDTDAKRRAWVEYQLALDHLAIVRKYQPSEGGISWRAERAEHDRWLKSARALDRDRVVYPIYQDQLAILDRLLPAAKASPQPSRQFGS